jgi:hypothetical protein
MLILGTGLVVFGRVVIIVCWERIEGENGKSFSIDIRIIEATSLVGLVERQEDLL